MTSKSHRWYAKADIPPEINAKLKKARKEYASLAESKQACYSNEKPSMAKALNQEIIKKLREIHEVEEEISKLTFGGKP